MVCEELLGELIKYQMRQKENPDVLRVNPDYYKMLLEQLAYPEWLIKRKMNRVNQTLLGINIEITGKIKKFELQKNKKLAES
ncbi:hypothetical protein CON65_02445 [Bacillus pseudomycoides]|uniref:Uncharacterized protein n=1 Tax=Bacillus pseudomycoides TaxID=64104 RepID=A0AA91VFX0_9BACI|nr:MULTISPECIES: hypothetical protein [Bacillus]PED84314.1 hypothetical protein CON65_02445 [Bacillus pseudomycoides]PEU15841.1 hypothetical protein CN524_06150 [Bacillus sp. AFS019443]PEU19723.1 hypothetical protein CN525_06130 [Bacillus sp. AFS014408]PFW64859.1 hypothetical protein COL20_02410 [Bacillus sp. AFS075034]